MLTIAGYKISDYKHQNAGKYADVYVGYIGCRKNKDNKDGDLL